MACIRTALALIGFGFGFGVGKFYGYLHDAGLHERLDPIRSTGDAMRTPTNMKGE